MIISALISGAQSFLGFRKAGPEILYLRKKRILGFRIFIQEDPPLIRLILLKLKMIVKIFLPESFWA